MNGKVEAMPLSLPTVYLESYPLPAFVISVTAIGQGPGQSQSQAQRFAQSHRQSKRGSVGSNASAEGVREVANGSSNNVASPVAQLAVPLANLDLDERNAMTPTPADPLGQGHDAGHGADGDEDEDEGATASTPVGNHVPTSPKSPDSSRTRRIRDGLRLSGSGASRFASKPVNEAQTIRPEDNAERSEDDFQESIKKSDGEDLLVAQETDDDVAPLPNIVMGQSLGQSQRSPRVQILWANEQWNRLAAGATLADLVQPVPLAAFTSWAEAQEEDVTDAVAHAAASFGLELQLPNGTGLMMDVVKTRHTGGSGLVIITATRIQATKVRPAVELPRTIQRTVRPPLSKSPAPKPKQTGTVAELSAEQPVPLCTDLLESTDWSKTSLGPRENWSLEVKFLVHIVFSSLDKSAVWVGPENLVIYNQAYASLVDHPKAFGRPAKEVWHSIWDKAGKDVELALSGEPVYRPQGLVLYKDPISGLSSETYISYSLRPMFDSNRNVVALWHPTTDHTAEAIALRRLETTRILVEEVTWARSRPEFFDIAARVLAANPIDAPFAAFYSAKKRDPLFSGGETSSGTELFRTATIGVPAGHPHVPKRVVLTAAVTKAATSIRANAEAALAAGTTGSLRSHSSSSLSDSFRSSSLQTSSHRSSRSGIGSSHPSSSAPSRSSWGSKKSSTHSGADSLALPFARAIESRQCVIIENSRELFSGLTIRQWDALPEIAIVVPLNLESASAAPPAVLLLGLNLYRPFDTEYEDWIQQVRGHLAAGLSTVIAFEEEIGHRAEKEKLARAKEAWFRGAAHEFRTPLSLIAAPIDNILNNNKLDSSMRKQLTIASRKTRDLQQLMTSLFDFTRLESGRVVARFSPVDLREFITDIGAIFRKPIERLGNVRLRIKAEEHDKICVDPALLEIVVSHLVVNALKATDHGSVTLMLSFTNDAALISVSDTGLGIPESEFEAATDVFHRSEIVKNRGSEGTGMGLALVKEIVRMHEGHLSIKSQTLEGLYHTPRGSTFTASIPLSHEATVDHPIASFGVYARQVAEQVMQWSMEVNSGSSDSDSGGIRKHVTTRSDPGSVSSGFRDGLVFEKSDVLLVVDTDKDMLVFMKTLFDPFCTVLTAQTSTAALQLAKKTPPNLVVSEYHIRPMSGIDLLKDLRHHTELRHVPTVILSSSTDDEQRMMALIAGADDFISKPFKPQELLLRVHLHMQIGKRRSMLEKLFTEREQELVVLTDSCPSGILRTDADGRLMYTNDSFREPAGIAQDEDVTTWLEYCDEETQNRLAPVWLDILTGDEARTNLQWKWKTGKAMSGVFIRLDKIRPGMSGIIACVTDISYQEEQLLEANRRRVEAEESKHMQELLVDLTSHEIRTPVSAILQCSSLVKENLVALKEQLRFAGSDGYKPSPTLLGDLEEDVEALESIYQCGLVQERIAGDVLSLARIQLDMLNVHEVEMDIRREARKVLSVFSSEAKMKKIEIALELGESLDRLGVSAIKTDPVRLGQVVTNLTANAIRFTATSAQRKITVRYDVAVMTPEQAAEVYDEDASDNDEDKIISAREILDQQHTTDQLPVPEDTPIFLFVSVTDTGPGMTPEEQEVLFQRFHQGNRMIHTQYGGSGLGLFICKKITELLGGQIEVESKVGAGSIFRFHIRTRTAAPTQAKIEGTGASLVPLVSPPLEQPSMSPFRVLVVEDNSINQMALKRQLTKAGLQCDTADNGQQALLAIHEANRQSRHDQNALAGYDVVLMDLEMPVMDGLTAVQHIREAEANGALRPQLVIALTGNARQAQIDQAMEAGMDDVVIKPYRLPALLTKLRTAVDARREAHKIDELHN